MTATKKSLALGLSLALASCTTAEPKPYESIPVARCGMSPYTLLDPAGLGEVVAFEEIQTLNLEPSAVTAFIKGSGYAAAPPTSYGTRVFRFRYTTQERGRKIEATATLGVPANADLPDIEFPAALFLHGTTGFTDACSPGRSLDGQAPAGLMGALGFIGVLPDYIGMNSFGDASTTTHGYLVGEQVAVGAWDALRAGRKLVQQLKLGLKVSAKTIVWGGSQGGHAALFTELYAPYYAPEFEVPAVVALVAPTIIPPLAHSAMDAYSAPTVSFGAVLATMREWYGQPKDFSAVFTDAAPYHFASTITDQVLPKGAECSTGAAYEPIKDHPDEQRVDIMFQQSFIDAVKQDRWSELNPWTCYLNENSLATSSVKPKRFTPTLMVYSEKDELVVTAPMREEFKHLCSLGYRLDYRECQGAAHSRGAVWSLPEQIAWIHDRLDGKPLLADACTVHEPICCAGSPSDVCGG